jgi:hypothetical protein
LCAAAGFCTLKVILKKLNNICTVRDYLGIFAKKLKNMRGGPSLEAASEPSGIN